MPPSLMRTSFLFSLKEAYFYADVLPVTLVAQSVGDSGLWTQRLASRVGGLDRRKVSFLERLRRGGGTALHERGTADQHQPLLGDPNDQFVFPSLPPRRQAQFLPPRGVRRSAM